MDGKHVFVTGGSSGLGLSTAKKYAQAGAKVSLVARDLHKLEKAKREIEAVSKHEAQRVFTQSCDVADFAAVQRVVDAANAFHERATDHVVCCAGSVEPGYFLEQDVAVFARSMDVNYFGSLYTIRAALPAMVECQKSAADGEEGHIVLVGSAFSLMGCIGSAEYVSAKFALRGLADTLRNELKLYNIGVSIFFAGNVDTPLYQHEQRQMPAEGKTIEGVSVPISPDSAAQMLVDGLRDGHYSITTDPLVFLLRILGNGVAPRYNAPLEALLMPLPLPLLLLIQTAFLAFMDGVAAYSRWKKTQQSDKKRQ